MHACIIMGSPRGAGNTAALLTPFCQALTDAGCTYTAIRAYDKTILPCTACLCCQQDFTGFGCPLPDDVASIFNEVLACDLLVLATPIYSWYCTPPLKALLDRLVYGMNKYYGPAKGPSLWQGKGLALLATCGYRPEHGADLWEAGMRRYCRHSGLTYMGMLAERDLGYREVFMTAEKEAHARDFAQMLLNC